MAAIPLPLLQMLQQSGNSPQNSQPPQLATAQPNPWEQQTAQLMRQFAQQQADPPPQSTMDLQAAARATERGYAGAQQGAPGSYSFSPASSPNMEQARQLHAKRLASEDNFLHPDAARRFAGPQSYIDDRTPLMKVTIDGTSAALPAWMLTKGSVPTIRGRLDNTDEEIGAMSPEMQRALQARNDMTSWSPDKVSPAAAAQEHAAHLVRAERRAKMHGSGSADLEAQDRALLGAEAQDPGRYSQIHGDAEAKREQQRNELIRAVAEGVGNDPYAGIDPAWAHANPREAAQLVESRMRMMEAAGHERAETGRATGHDSALRENEQTREKGANFRASGHESAEDARQKRMIEAQERERTSTVESTERERSHEARLKDFDARLRAASAAQDAGAVSRITREQEQYLAQRDWEEQNRRAGKGGPSVPNQGRNAAPPAPGFPPPPAAPTGPQVASHRFDPVPGLPTSERARAFLDNLQRMDLKEGDFPEIKQAMYDNQLQPSDLKAHHSGVLGRRVFTFRDFGGGKAWTQAGQEQDRLDALIDALTNPESR